MQLTYRKKRNREIMKKAQSTLEYAMVIFCVVAALLAMQVYIKRGMQGRLKAVADDLGSQYAPKNTDSDFTLELESDVVTKVETVEEDDKLKTTTTNTIIIDEQTRTGKETVGELEDSLF